MSQEDVQLVEGLLAASSAMNKEELLAALPDLAAQLCTEDIEWVEDPKRADGRTHHGPEEVLGSWRRWLENWDEFGFAAERFIDCGDEVLVMATEHGRGASSGASVEGRIFAAIAIRDGKIARYREFTDEHDARSAVGLP
jgi:uncharacterized protein